MSTPFKIILPFLMLFCMRASAQVGGNHCYSGLDTVQIGSSSTYNITGCSGLKADSWQITCGGTVLNFDSSSITIYWNLPGCTAAQIKAIKSGAVALTIPVVITTAPRPPTGGAITNNPVSITEWTQSPSIAINATLALGGSVGTIFSYQWQKAITYDVYQDIPGATSQNYVFPSPLTTGTTYLRRKASYTSGGLVSTIYTSNFYTVNVIDRASVISISPTAQTLLTGTAPSVFNSTVLTGLKCPNSTAYRYQWQYSATNTNFSDVAGATATSYTSGALTATSYFRCKVFCPSDTSFSNVATVTVKPHLSAITISPASVAPLNYNTSPGTFTGSTPAGGICGSYLYQWQSSTDSATWNNVGPNNISYTLPALTATTYIRLRVSCSSETQTSNAVKVVVYPPLTTSINPASVNINYNTSPGQITNTRAGGNGTYTYQWQYSINNGANWSAGPTTQNFAPGNLTDTTWYRVITTSNGVSVTSNTAIIYVYPQLTSAVSPASLSINYNTGPGMLTNTRSGGNGTYTYQWQYSTNSGGTWSAGLTTQNYTPGNLTATTWYRVITTSNGVSVTSNNSIFNVYAQLVAGTISAASLNINYNTSPGTLTGTVPTGGNGTYVYQWQSSTNGGSTWNNLATTSNYTGGNLTVTTQYRRAVTSNSLTLYSNFLTITVSPSTPQVTAGTVSPGYQQTNSYTQAPIGLKAGRSSVPSCSGASCFTYQWQQSANGSTGWTNIASATGTSYNPGSYQPVTTTYYRLRVSSPGATDGYSNVATIASQSSVITGPVDCWTGQTANYYYTGLVSPYSWGVNGGAQIIVQAGNFTLKWMSAGTYTINLNNNGTFYTVQVYVHNLPLDPCAINKPVQTSESGSTVPLSTWPSAAIGGNCTGNFTYQWQSSANGVDFVNVVGGTATDINVSPTQNTYYRRKVTCGTESAFTDTTQIEVYAVFNPGTITAGNTDSIAWNMAPLLINGTVPTGGTDTSYSYQWQYSDNGINFYDIEANAQGMKYQPGRLTASTWFRRGVTSGSTTRYTNSVLIKVKVALFNPGIITPYTLVINSGASPALTGTAAAGGTVASYSYQWQQSYDETSWKNCTNGATQNFSPGALTKTTYYRRIATNGPQTAFSVANSNFNLIKVKVVQGLGATNIPTTVNAPTSDPAISAIPINSYTLSAITPAKTNYVRTWEVEKPGVTTVAAAKALTNPNDYSQVTSYMDDLGRDLQSVAKQATPAQKDLVSVVNYDLLGRQVQQYLPYTDNTATGDLKTNAATQQPAFYNALYSSQEGFYYNNTQYEASPDNRPLKTTAPGKSWTGSNTGVRTDYAFNTSLDSVRLWTIGTTATSNPVTSDMYDPGTLAVVITTDEQENKVMEYKDRDGKIILKKVQLNDTLYNGHYGWLCTYYVYDVFNRLRYVLSPKAVEYAYTHTWIPSPTIRDETCFRYFYDEQGRMVIKKVPGAGEMWMVYDARGRMVMAQDSLYRETGNWRYIQYDSLNRPVLAGKWTVTGDRDYHQNLADASISYPAPASGYSILTQTYYDDYTWVAGSGSGLSASLITANGITGTGYFYAASNTTYPYPQAVLASTMTEGMVTGTKINVLGTTTFLYSITFYDDKGRPVQVHSNNYSGGKDTVTNQYSYSGRVLRTLACQQKAGTNPQQYRLLTKMDYDGGGRILNVFKQVGNSPEVKITENEYDELGRLAQKNIGRVRNSSSQNTYTTIPLDSLKYDYTIRGWLKGINRDYARNQNGASTWFGMELCYDYGFTSMLRNGGVAGVRWRNKADGEQRAYGFGYDNTNRLTDADFTQYSNSAWNTSAGTDFSVRSLSYDVNGNILRMTQFGLELNTSSIIDSLVYSYNASTNKLNYVTDKANDVNSLLGDFKEINNNTTQDYLYDGNGNLKQDNNKGISSITYNNLDLPVTVSFNGKGTITYTYDASGNKLRKVTLDTVGTDKTTRLDYMGAFVYQNDTLQYIAQEEGRIRPKRTGDADTMYYDYFEKDHLGNTRIVLTDEKQQDIYPAATLENNTNALNTEKAYYSINNADTISVNRIASWAATTGNNYANNNGNPPYNNNPYANTTAVSNFVYKLNGAAGKKTGLGITLKVMTGDVVDIYGKSFWHSNGVDPDNSYLLTSALTSFINAFAATSAVAGSGHGATGAALNGSTATTGGLNTFLGNVPNPGVTIPKAYINWILFDEQFKPVAGNSSFDLISTTDDAVKNHHSAVSINKGGYLYVYCSNESNIDVFFDNLQLIHTRGPLLSYENYYPHGGSLTGICSQAAGKLDNRFKYNGKEKQEKEFRDGSGLALYDYSARMYDPQIGRFSTIDPHADKYAGYTPYHYVYNNPTNSTDPTGMDTHLEGQAARDLFEIIQKNANRLEASNKSLDIGEVDDFARAAMDIYGGVNNFIIRAVLPVWESLTPEIYAHIKQAFSEGYPQFLHKGTILPDLLRGRATKPVKRLIENPNPEFLSADEYPMAFTAEGGWLASVRYVPKWEQQIQGIQTSAVSGILKPGDKFLVALMPRKFFPEGVQVPGYSVDPNGRWRPIGRPINREDYERRPAINFPGNLPRPVPYLSPEYYNRQFLNTGRNFGIGIGVFLLSLATGGAGGVLFGAVAF